MLLALRRLLHLPRLEYVSIQNQADFLIEVPVEMSDVPKVWPPASLALLLVTDPTNQNNILAVKMRLISC